MKRAYIAFCALIALFAMGCGDVVITINFPAAKIEKQAEEIVNEVRSGPATTNPDTDNDGLENYEEGGIDIGKTNKEIDEIKKRMKERYDNNLLKHYDDGVIGEQIDGYIGVRDFGEMDIKAKAEVKKLVSAENDDRGALYKLVAAINKVPNDIAKVAKIFAEKWREAAKPKHYVQDDKGNWMTKEDYDKKKKEGEDKK